jgi:hypothetical protein
MNASKVNSADARKSGVQSTCADVGLRGYQLKGAFQFFLECARGFFAIC